MGRLLLTAIEWYSVRHDRLLDEVQDPATVRFLLIRGLTIPAIYLLSIVISFFSVQAATWLRVILIVVDSVTLSTTNRRGVWTCLASFRLTGCSEQS